MARIDAGPGPDGSGPSVYLCRRSASALPYIAASTNLIEPTDGNIEACTGRPVFGESPFWLVELDDGSAPAVHFVARYDDAATCFGATFSHDLKRGGFAVCVPLDEDAEMELAEHIADEYGLFDGE